MCEKEISLLNIITNLVGSLIIVRKKNKSYSFKHNYVIYVILSQALFNLHLSFPFLHSKKSKQSSLRLYNLCSDYSDYSDYLNLFTTQTLHTAGTIASCPSTKRRRHCSNVSQRNQKMHPPDQGQFTPCQFNYSLRNSLLYICIDQFKIYHCNRKLQKVLRVEKITDRWRVGIEFE